MTRTARDHLQQPVRWPRVDVVLFRQLLRADGRVHKRILTMPALLTQKRQIFIDGGGAGRDADGIDQQGVAFRVVPAILEVLRDLDEPAVGGPAFADADALRNDVARGFIGRMDHLRAGILVLAVTRQRN